MARYFRIRQRLASIRSVPPGPNSPSWFRRSNLRWVNGVLKVFPILSNFSDPLGKIVNTVRIRIWPKSRRNVDFKTQSLGNLRYTGPPNLHWFAVIPKLYSLSELVIYSFLLVGFSFPGGSLQWITDSYGPR